jgi:hypothetical protein
MRITLPICRPKKPEAPKKKGFPDYPEGDLIARALRLAFVGGEGEGDEG